MVAEIVAELLASTGRDSLKEFYGILCQVGFKPELLAGDVGVGPVGGPWGMALANLEGEPVSMASLVPRDGRLTRPPAAKMAAIIRAITEVDAEN